MRKDAQSLFISFKSWLIRSKNLLFTDSYISSNIILFDHIYVELHERETPDQNNV